ncbi:MAG: hypothetical protein ACTJHU_05080 [Mycetocola sp.]
MPNPSFDPRYAAEFQPGFVAEEGTRGRDQGADGEARDVQVSSARMAARPEPLTPRAVTPLGRGQGDSSTRAVGTAPGQHEGNTVHDSVAEPDGYTPETTPTPPWRTAETPVPDAPPRRWIRNGWMWVLIVVGAGLLALGMWAQLSALGTSTGFYTGTSTFYDGEDMAQAYFFLQLSWALAPILITLGAATLIAVLFTIALSSFRERGAGYRDVSSAPSAVQATPRGESEPAAHRDSARSGSAPVSSDTAVVE